MKPGKVYLVGAGPGHPELLTIKAADLIRAADVLVYDRLIQEEVLALAKPSAERLYMGKPVGKHDSRQDEIHELLVRKAREGKTVIRLKGGDPFLFGRGGEEAEYLAAHGIAFEVIPGVSSALAAPMSAGIPVTHRERASCVAIVTGHEAKEEQSGLDWSALARMDTLVFLMGVKNAGTIAERLMAHGRDPKTPAAMIQMAFWHDERVLTSTLENLGADVEREGIKPPATLVVGEVVGVRERLQAAQRDLRRRPDGSSRFEPAPAPDQLFRLATGSTAAQVFGYALEAGLFDRLESQATAESLARSSHADVEALGEVLDALVALGLVERSGSEYRNLDLASRYLRAVSPESLHPALLEEARRTGSWEELSRFLHEGERTSQTSSEDACHAEACESMARFGAASVAEKLDLGHLGPVLLVGWGSEAFSRALLERWPGLTFSGRNPFTAGAGSTDSDTPLRDEKSASRGAMILSGLLSSCDRGQVAGYLAEAGRILRPGGVLVLYDAFLPSGPLPPPEVVLGGLGRRIARGGCRTWSVERLSDALHKLGFEGISSQALPAGTVLVTASKP